MTTIDLAIAVVMGFVGGFVGALFLRRGDNK
jgi:hypothetical protein